MSVLRSKGYDGSSLNELAAACGLQKASLYHRYPGGKKDIALAVLQFVGQWTEDNIVAVVADQIKSPQARLQLVLKNVDAIYQSGQASCLMRALSMDSGLVLFGEDLKLSMERWIAAFTTLGLAFGLQKESARETALQVMIQIQGSLVVSKTMQSVLPFTKALVEIEAMYESV